MSLRLISQCNALALAVLLIAHPVQAAKRAVLEVRWSELREEVFRRGLAGRKVTVVLPGQGEVKTRLV